MKKRAVVLLSGGLDSVSYTHLDVYKRQVSEYVEGGLSGDQYVA